MTPSDETTTPPEALPPPQAPATAPPAPEKVEMIRKVYARDLRDKDVVLTVFRIGRKERHVSRSGKPYLALALVDRTGEIDARIFEAADEAAQGFEAGDYALIKGHVITFHGKPQVVIDRLERLDPEPIDPKEFTPPPAEPRPAAAEPSREGNKVVAQIRELVERVHDPFVQKLLLAFLDDPQVAKGLPHAPAAKGVHHAYRGGLADHILSVMKLAHRIADQYPMADRDLLVAGAMLHDIGKVRELTYDNGFGYSDEGRLVGHLVMTAQQIHAKAANIPGFPQPLEHHLTHLVLAHHGRLEYGSPRVPMTLEALLVHLIDLMDSRVACWLETMAKDSNERWAEPTRTVDHHLWKGPAPTSRNKSPVEPRRRRPREKEREPKRRAPEAEAPPPVEAAPKPVPEVEKTAKPRDSGLPKDLTFKPFHLLAEKSEGGES